MTTVYNDPLQYDFNTTPKYHKNAIRTLFCFCNPFVVKTTTKIAYVEAYVETGTCNINLKPSLLKSAR